jgi:hypothetical protein
MAAMQNGSKFLLVVLFCASDFFHIASGKRCTDPEAAVPFSDNDCRVGCKNDVKKDASEMVWSKEGGQNGMIQRSCSCQDPGDHTDPDHADMFCQDKGYKEDSTKLDCTAKTGQGKPYNWCVLGDGDDAAGATKMFAKVYPVSLGLLMAAILA